MTDTGNRDRPEKHPRRTYQVDAIQWKQGHTPYHVDNAFWVKSPLIQFPKTAPGWIVHDLPAAQQEIPDGVGFGSDR